MLDWLRVTSADAKALSPNAESAPRPRSLLRAVAVPAEHGGWGLTAEPVALGLLVAPSISAGLLLVAAFGAFLARTPLKIALGDWRRRRRLPRTMLARRVVTAELVIIGTALATVALRSSRGWWLSLLAAVPLAGVEIYFDMQAKGRRLVPELCGAAAISSTAAAIARAGGARWELAGSLSLLLVARAIGSVPFARAEVMRWRRRSVDLRVPILAQGVAFATAGAGSALWAVPWPSVLAIATFGLWAIWSLQRRPIQPKLLG